MNLGIIGAGSLGAALGKRLSGAGHAILYGTGAEPKPAAALDGAEVGTNSEAAAMVLTPDRLRIADLRHPGHAADEDDLVDLAGVRPASLSALRHGSIVFCTRSSTRLSNLARESFIVRCLGPDASAVM